MQNKLNRKLAAIMFADMPGFTALMQKDEALAMQKRSKFKEVSEKLHTQFNGEIVKYLGDGSLSVFSNSVDAVNCAIEILKQLRGPFEVSLRIGIHSGNVLFEDGDIMGDAVNIASRIESFSIPGGVMISDSVHDQILNQTGLEFVSLGKFKLKNVERPFEIYAVATEGIVVPDSGFLIGKGERLSNLMNGVPNPTSPILGREKDLASLSALLRDNRIVTITGAGGMGKTRIATEICHLLAEDFCDGITFVSLADFTDPAELIPALANSLGIKEALGRTLNDAITQLVDDKKSLFVLDNLEQIIDVAPSIAAMSLKCPNLKILTTSRTPLKVKAEREYTLSPLSLPADQNQLDLTQLIAFPAVELFVERANKVKPGFELTNENVSDIVEICKRLDGHPLAIELAAARIKMLTPKSLLQRLEHALDILTSGNKDLPERHQTLRTTIDWSYSLLNDEEKQLFRRIAVFSEGFSLEGVESVCYENKSAAALDTLESLIDKGLVQQTGEDSRFRMLQTIKAFAQEKLDEAGETDMLRMRHAFFYRDYAESVSQGLETFEQAKWMKQAPGEEPNINSALEYLIEKAREGNVEATKAGLALSGSLWFYWHFRGRHIKAHEDITALMNAAGCPESGIEKCNALLTAGLASWTLGYYQRCLEEWQTALTLSADLSDNKSRALVACCLGVGYIGIDMELSQKYSEEAVAISQKYNYTWLLGLSISFNGLIKLIMGDVASAKTLLEKALSIHTKINDLHGIGMTLSTQALISSKEGNQDTAIGLYKKSIIAWESLPDLAESARVHSEIAWTFLLIKDIVSARKHFLRSIELYEMVGSIRGVGLSMIGIASVEAVEEKFIKAVQIAAAAEVFIEQGGIVNVYTDDFAGKTYIENARGKLSPSDFKSAKETGNALSVKEALLMANS